MSRHPPVIVSVLPAEDGGLDLAWELDTFFPDAEPGDKVLVFLNGQPLAALDGDELATTVPRAALEATGTAVVTIGVAFWWDGSPPEEQHTAIQVPMHTGGVSGITPAAKPTVTVVAVEPKTLHAPNRITVAWRSNNYNDGNLVWGPEGAPTAFRRGIRPRGETYHGEFTTDQPLASGALYAFRVEVRNTLVRPDWTSTALLVRSATNFSSLRDFLTASGVPTPTGVRALMAPGTSLRRMLMA